jgi:uncharacterized membrane protein
VNARLDHGRARGNQDGGEMTSDVGEILNVFGQRHFIASAAAWLGIIIVFQSMRRRYLSTVLYSSFTAGVLLGVFAYLRDHLENQAPEFWEVWPFVVYNILWITVVSIPAAIIVAFLFWWNR